MPDDGLEAGTSEVSSGTQETCTESVESLNVPEESPAGDDGYGGKL